MGRDSLARSKRCRNPVEALARRPCDVRGGSPIRSLGCRQGGRCRPTVVRNDLIPHAASPSHTLVAAGLPWPACITATRSECTVVSCCPAADALPGRRPVPRSDPQETGMSASACHGRPAARRGGGVRRTRVSAGLGACPEPICNAECVPMVAPGSARGRAAAGGEARACAVSIPRGLLASSGISGPHRPRKPCSGRRCSGAARARHGIGAEERPTRRVRDIARTIASSNKTVPDLMRSPARQAPADGLTRDGAGVVPVAEWGRRSRGPGVIARRREPRRAVERRRVERRGGGSPVHGVSRTTWLNNAGWTGG